MKTLTHWKNFFQFLINPSFLEQEIKITSKLKIIINLFILKVIINVLLILLFSLILIPMLGIEIELKDKNLQSLYNPILLFVMVAILEEFSFRGFLAKFNPLLFSISVAGIIGIYFKKLYYNNMVFDLEGLIETGILMLLIFGIAFLISKNNIPKMNAFWDHNFKIIIITSAVLFAFAHTINLVEFELKNLVLNLSQLFGAFIFTFIRMRSGLVFVILLHFIWNLIIGF